ncbi:MAG TPA: helix-turn-helix domain-containing protein [Pseudogracilibacillus sp.]|nr:helix-turn-helix domain-containing protein [Pseudogracilibacillus sp.]
MDIRIEYDHPIEVTLHVVCGKWKGVILCCLVDRVLRFGEIRKEIPRITQKMLTQQLRELEEDNLVKRVIYNEMPPRVEYSLTPYGEKLKPMLETLAHWGDNHVQMVKKIKEQDKAAPDVEVKE